MLGLDAPDADGFTVFEGHGTCTTESAATDKSACGSSGTPVTKPDTSVLAPATDCSLTGLAAAAR
jgi:hypothetical protein